MSASDKAMVRAVMDIPANAYVAAVATGTISEYEI